MFSMYTKCLAFLGISCIECFLLNIGRFIRVEYNGSRCKWFLYVTEHLIFMRNLMKAVVFFFFFSCEFWDRFLHLYLERYSAERCI